VALTVPEVNIDQALLFKEIRVVMDSAGLAVAGLVAHMGVEDMDNKAQVEVEVKVMGNKF